MVGVFYAAPDARRRSPLWPTWASRVKKGDALCILEAMKLMNEIAAEEDGVITRYLRDERPAWSNTARSS